MAAAAAPKTSSPGGSSSASGASSGSASARHAATPAIRVARALPRRTMACPISGRATITPIDIVSSTSPSVLLERSKRSCTNGICAAHAPIAPPLTKNTPKVAARGVTPPVIAGR
jgi:hypothetical protein